MKLRPLVAAACVLSSFSALGCDKETPTSTEAPTAPAKDSANAEPLAKPDDSARKPAKKAEAVLPTKPPDDSCKNPVVAGLSIGPIKLGMAASDVEKIVGGALVAAEGRAGWHNGGFWSVKLDADQRVSEIRYPGPTVCLAGEPPNTIDLKGNSYDPAIRAYEGCELVVAEGGTKVRCSGSGVDFVYAHLQWEGEVRVYPPAER